MTANISLIKLNMALEHFEPVRLPHKVADLLAHAPRGLVGHAKRALKFLAAHAMARRDEKIDRIEPRLQRRAAILKDRSGARINVVAAMRARKARRSGELMESNPCRIERRRGAAHNGLP